jgi:hypothetical protein
MPTTYDPIATATVSGSSTNSVVFSSIPQTYTDLVLVCSSRSAQAITQPQIFAFENSDFSTSRSSTTLYGNGTSAVSTRSTGSAQAAGWIAGASATSGIFAATIMQWFNYANTTTFKTCLTRSSADLGGSGITSVNVKLWPVTTAISSIYVSNDANNNWVAGSTFTLYGIKSA